MRNRVSLPKVHLWVQCSLPKVHLWVQDSLPKVHNSGIYASLRCTTVVYMPLGG